VIAPAALRDAAVAIAACRWARLGDCAVVSRHVHGHGEPGDAKVGVYLGMDAGQNLYGLESPGQVLHVDIFHSAGRCSERHLRAHLTGAARRLLAGRGGPADETQRVLRWVEARCATAEEGRGAGGPEAAEAGHVHLALRALHVPLEFVPLAVEAAEQAILESGLDLLALAGVEPTWESALRPPCACGTTGGAPAAGSAGGLRGQGTGEAGADGPAAAPAGGAPGPDASAGRPGGTGAEPAATTPPPSRGRTAAPAYRVVADPAPMRQAPPAPAQSPRRLPLLPPAGVGTPRNGGRGVRPGRTGEAGDLLQPVESVVVAARTGAPVRPAAADLRYAPRRHRRPDPVLLALDRSASMAERLPAAAQLAEALRRAGQAVGLYALPLADGDTPGDADFPPTRSAAALAAALARLCAGATGGGTDLAAGLSALAERLREHRDPRRLVCCIVTDGLATGDGDPFAAALAAAATLRAVAGVRLYFRGPAAFGDRLAALAAAAGGRYVPLG